MILNRLVTANSGTLGRGRFEAFQEDAFFPGSKVGKGGPEGKRLLPDNTSAGSRSWCNIDGSFCSVLDEAGCNRR